MGRLVGSSRVLGAVALVASLLTVGGMNPGAAQAASCEITPYATLGVDKAAVSGEGVLVGPAHVYTQEQTQAPDGNVISNDWQVWTLGGQPMPHIEDFQVWTVDSGGLLWGNEYPTSQHQIRDATGSVIANLDGEGGFVGFIHEFGDYRWRLREDQGSGPFFDIHNSAGALVTSVPTATGIQWLDYGNGRAGYSARATSDGDVVAVIARIGATNWVSLYARSGTKIADLPRPPGRPTAGTQSVLLSGNAVLVLDNTNSPGDTVHRYSTSGSYLGTMQLTGDQGLDFYVRGGSLDDAGSPAISVDGAAFWLGRDGTGSALYRISDAGSIAKVAGLQAPLALGESGGSVHVIDSTGPNTQDRTLRTLAPDGTVLGSKTIGDYDFLIEDGVFASAGVFAVGHVQSTAGPVTIDLVSNTGRPIGEIYTPRKGKRLLADTKNGVLAVREPVRSDGFASGPYRVKLYDITRCPSSGQPPLPPSPNPCPPGVTCDSAAFIDAGGRWFVWDEISVDASKNVFYYGNPGDAPFMGDWNGDGVATPGLYRQGDGFAYLRNSNTQGVADRTFYFGNPGDVPLVGDFNGDGKDTLSIYRQSEGRVYIINRLGEDGGGLGAADYSFYFGNPGDQPFVGDFDGNGIDTVGLYRTSSGFAYFRNSNSQGNADFEFYYGNPGDVIMAGDWRGTGVDTVAVYRPSNGYLYLNFQNAPGNADATFSAGLYAAATTAGRD